jgi:hypothetical protein
MVCNLASTESVTKGANCQTLIAMRDVMMWSTLSQAMGCRARRQATRR